MGAASSSEVNNSNRMLYTDEALMKRYKIIKLLLPNRSSNCTFGKLVSMEIFLLAQSAISELAKLAQQQLVVGRSEPPFPVFMLI